MPTLLFDLTGLEPMIEHANDYITDAVLYVVKACTYKYMPRFYDILHSLTYIVDNMGE